MCVVTPPPVFANTTATTATRAVASRHDACGHEAMSVGYKHCSPSIANWAGRCTLLSKNLR
jgi:hypothetical protein